MKYIFTDWLELRIFYICSACLFWTVYIYKRYRNDKLILQQWGFRKKHFKQSFLFLLPFALATIAAIVWYGISLQTNFLNWHVIPIILFYPVWGIIQQFLITALVAGNLWTISRVKFNNPQIIILTSVLFAVVHYPSMLLMVFTFFMQLLFISAFFRWRNLWPLGLFHGWVASLLLFFILGRDLWIELWVVF